MLFSTRGFLRGKLPIVRPHSFQFQVWLEKEKYLSQGKINPSVRAMEVSFKNFQSETENKRLDFPQGHGVYCFFSQVMECAAVTGFLAKAIEKRAGKMNFHLLFSAFPYFKEQYPGTPKSFFSEATLNYDGQISPEEIRFSLNFGGTTVWYFVNQSLQMVKMFWPAQGLSLVEKKT